MEDLRNKRPEKKNCKRISYCQLHVNGLNSPNKGQRLAKCIKTHDSTIYCLQYN